MEPDSKKGNGRRIFSSFWFWYGAVCALIAAVLAVLIALFYGFIREYERTRPEHVVESYVNALDGQTLTKMFGDQISARASGFEAEDAASAELNRAFEQGIVFTECVGGDNPAYDVFCGGRLMKISLRQKSAGKYGFVYYEVGGVEFYPDWAGNRCTSARVIVPAEAELEINGLPVGERYRTGVEYRSAVLSGYETADPALVEYRVEDIFGPVEVTGKYRGQALTFSGSARDGVYYSDFALPSLFDYTVMAPESAKVTFNGRELTDDFLTQTVRLPEAVSEFEAGRAPFYRVYTVKGLLFDPAAEAVLDGKKLDLLSSERTKCVFAMPGSDYTVRVPHGVTLYCNGVGVGEAYRFENAGLYDSPGEGYPSTVRYDLYTLTLCSEPTFTVSTENSVCRQSGNQTVFLPALDDGNDRLMRAEARLFAELFIKYSLQGGSKVVKANYDECMKHVLPGSEAYQTIAATFNAFKYNSSYNIEKMETKVYDLIRYSDDCCGVKVDFESLGVSSSHEKPANGTYTMIWILSDNQWKLAMFSL